MTASSSQQVGCNALQQHHLCGAGNMLTNSLKSTGAFEVYYNEQQVGTLLLSCFCQMLATAPSVSRLSALSWQVAPLA